jgi:hypothetical protein
MPILMFFLASRAAIQLTAIPRMLYISDASGTRLKGPNIQCANLRGGVHVARRTRACTRCTEVGELEVGCMDELECHSDWAGAVGGQGPEEAATPREKKIVARQRSVRERCWST